MVFHYERATNGNDFVSRDHVVPLATGGRMLTNNVVLAHRICNCRRGIRPFTEDELARVDAIYKAMGLTAVIHINDASPEENTRRMIHFTQARIRTYGPEIYGVKQPKMQLQIA